MSDTSTSTTTTHPSALVLHGGGGPRTVAAIGAHLAGLDPAYDVVLPTHPGWEGTPRRDDVTSVADLAEHYLRELESQGRRDTVLIGSSLGGWIALEMAISASTDPARAGLVRALVVVDGIGPDIRIPGEEPVDFFALDARGIAEHAWFDADRGYVDPATLTSEQVAVQRAAMASMAALAGPTMSDPTLADRLGAISVPTLVLWGEADRIATPAYGRAVAERIPGAQFVTIPRAGHLPQLESALPSVAAIDAFLS